MKIEENTTINQTQAIQQAISSAKAEKAKQAEQAESNPEISKSEDNAPERRRFDEYVPSEKAEQCTANTDSVDAEIKSLKERQQQIQREMRTADGAERANLEKQLEQINNELMQKDNDDYRRSQTVFS